MGLLLIVCMRDRESESERDTQVACWRFEVEKNWGLGFWVLLTGCAAKRVRG